MGNILNFKNWVRMNESMMINEYTNPGISLLTHPDVKAFVKVLNAEYKKAKTTYQKNPDTGTMDPFTDYVPMNTATYEYAGDDLYIYTPASTGPEKGAVANSRTLYPYTIGKSKHGMPCFIALSPIWYSEPNNRGAVGKASSFVSQGLTEMLPKDGVLLFNTYDETGLGWKGADDAVTATTTTQSFCTKWATSMMTTKDGSSIMKAMLFNSFYVRNKAELDKNKGTKGLAKYLQVIFDTLASGATTTTTTTKKQ